MVGAAKGRTPPRKLSDRLPVLGWLGLRRERDLHGAGFWIRPLAVEVLTGVALATLYVLETHNAVRLWPFPGMPLPRVDFLTDNLPLCEHLRTSVMRCYCA